MDSSLPLGTLLNDTIWLCKRPLNACEITVDFGFPRLKKSEPAEPLFFVESIVLFYEVDKSVFGLLKAAHLSSC